MPATYFRYETAEGPLDVQLAVNGWARISAYWTKQVTHVDPHTGRVRLAEPDRTPDLPTDLLSEIRRMWGR